MSLGGPSCCRNSQSVRLVRHWPPPPGRRVGDPPVEDRLGPPVVAQGRGSSASNSNRDADVGILTPNPPAANPDVPFWITEQVADRSALSSPATCPGTVFDAETQHERPRPDHR